MIGKQTRMETWMLMNKMDDRQHPSIDLHFLSPWDMSRTTAGCFLPWNLHDRHAPKLRKFAHIQSHVRSQALVLKMKPNVVSSIEN
jgi:hypothetical protein